jgi:hypothetical protein
MAKMTIKEKGMLKAHSLIEVIVSTIIILITFLLFSSLIGQLVTESRNVQRVRMLFYTGGSSGIDTQNIRKVYPDCNITLLHTFIDKCQIANLQITDSITGKLLYQYYFSEEEGNLFVQ